MKYCSGERRAKGVMAADPSQQPLRTCLPEYFMYMSVIII
jgi:hypothetical protein